MRKVLSGVLFFIICLVFPTFSQEEKAFAEIHYSNYDPFFEFDTLTSSPVLPASGTPKRYGYTLPWVKPHQLSRVSNDYLMITPVAELLGSYATGDVPTMSTRESIGFCASTHIANQFYARVLLTAGHYFQDGDIAPYSTIFHAPYWSKESGKSSFYIQPRIRLSYAPFDFLNIQAGLDQNFIGHGRRSMLLGDYNAPYPFVQLRTRIWHLEISNLYQFFQEDKGLGNYVNKFASTHFFNWRATKRFQIGLFESVIFAAKDTLMNRGYDLAYLNPILFYRPTEYGLGSQDRLLIGINTSYETKHFMVYGQFAFDEFLLKELISSEKWWGNKFAGQFGLKGREIFQAFQWHWLVELNFARPFTYSHSNISTVYGEQGKPLAHPTGSNFAEIYFYSRMEFKHRLSLTARFFFIQQGGMKGNDKVSYGNDIYMPYQLRPHEYGWKIGGDGRLNRTNGSLEVSYRPFPKLNMEVFLRPGIEQFRFIDESQTKFYIYGGLKSSLWNDRSLEF